MKKGELSRIRIAETAKRLFFEKGYDGTSIQDILDALDLSKGGFYHHFESKQAILSEICAQQIAQSLQKAFQEISRSRLTGCARLAALLQKVSLFEREEVPFAAIMLKVCYVDGDAVIRQKVRDLTLEQLSPHVDVALSEAQQAEEIYIMRRGRIGDLVLNLCADINDMICAAALTQIEQPEHILEVMEIADNGEEFLETVLCASQGTLRVLDAERFVKKYQQTCQVLAEMERRSKKA